MSTSNFSSATLRDYLRVLFRQKHIVLLMVVLVTGFVFIGAELKTPVFEAHAKMLISGRKQVDTPYYTELSGYNPAEKITVTQSEIVKSTPVLQRAVDALGLYSRPEGYEKDYASRLKGFFIDRQIQASPLRYISADDQRAYRFRIAIEKLRSNVEVQPLRDSNTFLIKVRDFDPVMAAAIANTVSRSYVIYDLEQQVAELQMKYGGKHPVVVQIRDNINKMYKTLGGTAIPNIDAIGPASVKIIEQAIPPIATISVSRKLLVALAAVMSLVLGVILAFVFDFLDPAVKTLQEAENVLGAPVLGSIPKNRNKKDAFLSSFSDQVYLLVKDKDIKTILLSSIDAGSDSTDISFDLAARLGDKFTDKILLVDANLRDPSLHKRLKSDAKPGLAEYLEGKAEIRQIIRTSSKHLDVITAGQTEMNPLALLSLKQVGDILDYAAKNYALTLVAAPSASANKDALILAEKTNGVIFLIEESRTRREVVRYSLQDFLTRKVNVLGSVLNGRTFPIPRFFYDLL